jgi:glycerol dehydrogenase
LAEQARATGCDGVLALGGGKAIDTAKGVAKALQTRLVIASTVASNDSPTSRLIVIYDDAHWLAEVQSLLRNPDAVVVDTDVICRAPLRFFAAGLGDALSKRFESAQCAASGGHNFFGGRPLGLALAMGERCYATLREDASAALARVAAGLGPDEAVERVVEATVLLSGLAFKSGGLSLAHALNRGFTAHALLSAALHGEMVAFGAIVQLIAQEESADFVQEHAAFTQSLGLPVCFADLGAPAVGQAEVLQIAELSCKAPYIGHLRPPATIQRVADALWQADALGRRLQRRLKPNGTYFVSHA